ncbi:hypothetical protein BKA21_000851 [Cellulomonas oligotrophica]|uniref:Uncharacterized protein n=1 Tax=Cellulomonas oligotrophica TaxID=931536 RepID=A0A7Y9FE53_9CELL|nr:hypothetical protein [Cellulomonas oligotrophica]
MVRRGWSDAVVTIDTTRRDHRQELRIVRHLRDEGIAEPG